MAIDKKDRKDLNKMWGGKEAKAKSTGLIPIPDGEYQIKILNAEFKMSGSGKPQFVTGLKVVGGEEEHIDVTFQDFDSLETPENMGWFKSKLAKLGIDFDNDDMDFVIDGKCAEKMIGLVFAGKVVTKGAYPNLYVNSLVSDADESEETESGYDEENMPEMDDVKNSADDDEEEIIEDDDEEEIEPEEDPEIEVDDIVTWKSKGVAVNGVITKVLEDEEKAIVEKEDGKKIKIKLENLYIVYESDVEDDETEEEIEEEETEEEEIEEEETDESYKDKVKKINKLKKSEVADKLETYNLAGNLKSGKSILTVLCAIEAEEKCSKDELKLACNAYGIVIKSSDNISKITQLISAEIDAAKMN